MMMISRPRVIAADAANEPAVAIGDRNDLRAVGTDDDGAGLGALLAHLHVARAVTEAVDLVVTHVRLPARIANDHAIRLAKDGAPAFLRLATLGAEAVELARPRALRDRRDRCCGRRRGWRQGRRHGRRREPLHRGVLALRLPAQLQHLAVVRQPRELQARQQAACPVQPAAARRRAARPARLAAAHRGARSGLVVLLAVGQTAALPARCRRRRRRRRRGRRWRRCCRRSRGWRRCRRGARWRCRGWRGRRRLRRWRGRRCGRWWRRSLLLLRRC